MPTDTAMEILKAYRLKQSQNPAADPKTLFKHILWDRFADSMVTDEEMAQIAASCRSLSDLALAVWAEEKPGMADSRVRTSAEEAIRRFYSINYPDGL